jgi:RNA polymerase sigma-70 factor, ECF subfamily
MSSALADLCRVSLASAGHIQLAANGIIREATGKTTRPPFCAERRRSQSLQGAFSRHILATDKELSDFLRSVERRAFKRGLYHVRDEEAALDIVQDSMMKLAENYGDKPLAELPMLFQRILSNTILDWFRRQKTRQAVISNLSELPAGPEGDDDPLETLQDLLGHEGTESAEDALQRAQTLETLETSIMDLPQRQREAFLMRYWEEMDLAETAAVMGCSQGSVKTHCFRAIQALSEALRAKGFSK